MPIVDKDDYTGFWGASRLLLFIFFMFFQQRNVALLREKKDDASLIVKGIILPSYLSYLKVLILVSLIYGGILIGLTDRWNNISLLSVNTTQFAIFNMLFDGLSVFLLRYGAGTQAFIKAMQISSIWGLFCGVLMYFEQCLVSSTQICQFIPPNSFETQFHLLLLFYNLLLLLFYGCLIFLPEKMLYRRSALFQYSVFNFSFHIFQIFLLYFYNDETYLYFLPFLAIFVAILQPLSVFKALQEDSEYWQGLSPDARNPLAVVWEQIGVDAASMMSSGLSDIESSSDIRIPILHFGLITMDERTKYVSGGFSRVYFGSFRSEPVALKVLFNIELTPTDVSDFYKEAKILNVLEHPNVVSCKGICIMPPALTIVLEKCEYGSLFDFIHNRLPNGQSERWILKHQPIDVFRLGGEEDDDECGEGDGEGEGDFDSEYGPGHGGGRDRASLVDVTSAMLNQIQQFFHLKNPISHVNPHSSSPTTTTTTTPTPTVSTLDSRSNIEKSSVFSNWRTNKQFNFFSITSANSSSSSSSNSNHNNSSSSFSGRNSEFQPPRKASFELTELTTPPRKRSHSSPNIDHVINLESFQSTIKSKFDTESKSSASSSSSSNSSSIVSSPFHDQQQQEIQYQKSTQSSSSSSHNNFKEETTTTTIDLESNSNQETTMNNSSPSQETHSSNPHRSSRSSTVKKKQHYKARASEIVMSAPGTNPLNAEFASDPAFRQSHMRPSTHHRGRKSIQSTLSSATVLGGQTVKSTMQIVQDFLTLPNSINITSAVKSVVASVSGTVTGKGGPEGSETRSSMSFRSNPQGKSPDTPGGTEDNRAIITEEFKLRMMLDAASAIQFLHSKGYMHCDMKSLNFLVGKNYSVKLSDMGEVRHLSQPPKRPTPPIPALNWAPPEVLKPGATADVFTMKSDVFGLILILYEIYTWELPFGDSPAYSKFELWYQRLTEEKLRPHLPSYLPSSFKDLFEWGWETDPILRPPAKVVSEILEDYCQEFSVIKRDLPPSSASFSSSITTTPSTFANRSLQSSSSSSTLLPQGSNNLNNLNLQQQQQQQQEQIQSNNNYNGKSARSSSISSVTSTLSMFHEFGRSISDKEFRDTSAALSSSSSISTTTSMSSHFRPSHQLLDVKKVKQQYQQEEMNVQQQIERTKSIRLEVREREKSVSNLSTFN